MNWGVDIFDTLPNPPQGHRWDENWDANLSTTLEQYKDRQYEERNVRRARGDTTPLELVLEDIFQQENAQTPGQKRIVYHHLLKQMQLAWYLEQTNPNTAHYPNMQMVRVNGKPGTGKSWILKCLTNMQRLLAGKNDADLATAGGGPVASSTRTFKR